MFIQLILRNWDLFIIIPSLGDPFQLGIFYSMIYLGWYSILVPDLFIYNDIPRFIYDDTPFYSLNYLGWYSMIYLWWYSMICLRYSILSHYLFMMIFLDLFNMIFPIYSIYCWIKSKFAPKSRWFFCPLGSNTNPFKYFGYCCNWCILKSKFPSWIGLDGSWNNLG